MMASVSLEDTHGKHHFVSVTNELIPKLKNK